MKNERKEQEKEIMAQMKEAMEEQKTEQTETPKKTGVQQHCPRCKVLMENGKCPCCGQKVYTPMDEQKQKKIRWITTGIALVIFLVIFLATR